MVQTGLFRSGAALVLLIILGALFLLWSLPLLGFSADPATGMVLAVEPGSPAAEQGMQVGDQILAIYGYPWSEAGQRLGLVPIPWQPEWSTPIVLLQAGEVRSIIVHPGAPVLALQVEKLLRTLLALVCWITGYLLGTSPRAVRSKLHWVGWFWIVLGGTLGLHHLLTSTSYLLTIALVWVQCTLLAPLAVAIHRWYPSRPIAHDVWQRAERILLWVLGVLQLLACGLWIASPSLLVFNTRLQFVAPVVFLVSFCASAMVLWQAYRTTTIAHLRRQIRLILAACVLVAAWWALVLMGERSLPNLVHALPPGSLTLTTALIPLSYLIGGVSADLMRFDQIARRMVLHAATLLLILTLLSVLVQLDRVVVTPLVGLLSITALYHPVYTLVHRLAKNAFQKQRPVDALHQANARLGTTLETPQLATIIREGLQAACDHPPLAIYVQDQASGQQGYRMTAEGLEVPEHIDFVQLEAIWGNQPDVLPAVAVQQMAQQTLAPELAALIYHPSITLWGIMRHGQGHSIGLIVLGPRRDLDPYRERDLVELCQTLAATSLAFTNSLSYREQVEAEATIRHLYHAVQFEHERTAAAIAREIHDEALNVNLRLNIQAIQRLIAEVRDPILRTKLVRILESAQALSQMLRLICEQLQPTSFDDPLGLTLSLRRHIEQIQALWDDTIAFDIEHEPVPVSPLVHHELVRIAQEALINAVKHAEATRIAVHLRFPAQPGEPLTLAITDNGRTQQAIAPQRGHWGLRYMQESADNIGGSMYWERCIGGGTCVAVIVPNLLHADPIEGDKPENHANPAYTHAS